MRIVIGICFFFLSTLAVAQQVFVPWSRATHEEIKSSLIDQKGTPPLAIKPWNAQKLDLDSVWGYADDSIRHYYWITEALFSKHFIELKEENINITLDPLIDIGGGFGAHDTINLRTNTRGFWAQADIAGKVQFATLVTETQILPQNYERVLHDSTTIINGWGRAKALGATKDIGLSQGWLSVPVSSWLTFSFGHGKHSFGHGHRQLLLSDNAPAYPFGSLDFYLARNKLHYRAVFAELQSLARKPLGEVPESLYKEKNATFHLLSYKPIDQLEIGLGHLSMWQRYDELDGNLPFRYESLVPLPGYSLARYGLDDEGVRSAVAANIAIDIRKWGRVYGQALYSTEGKLSGIQGGMELFDFLAPHLHLQFEYNEIQPWVYTSSTPLNGLTHINQSLGSVIGSDSREYLAKLSYRYHRWFARGQYNYIERSDGAANNVILTRPSSLEGFARPLGVINYAELRLGYMFNPKYNLELYIRLLDRNARFDDRQERTQSLQLGLATSLFQRKTDF